MTTIPLPFETFPMDGAEISPDGFYRYKLWRTWVKNGSPVNTRRVLWVMLNPSTADEQTDDATIRRCRGFSRNWGYGGLMVMNLFAYRATNPKVLKVVEDPVGRSNMALFDAELEQKDRLIVAAWGDAFATTPREYHPYITAMVQGLREHGAKCLGHTKSGNPRHPVRLPYATELEDL